MRRRSRMAQQRHENLSALLRAAITSTQPTPAALCRQQPQRLPDGGAGGGGDRALCAARIPALTGTPTVPTAAVDTNTTQAASTRVRAGRHRAHGLQRRPQPAAQSAVQHRAAGGGAVYRLWVLQADRWANYPNGGDTMSATVIAVSDTGRAQVGDEAFSNALQIGVVGSSSAGAFSLIFQKIEGVRRLAGQSVTVSFWARCNVVAKIGVSWHQYFGTGGSPSAEISGPGQAVAVATAGSYAHYSVTMALPSVAGMTLGTNGDDSTPIYIWLSAQAAQNTASGGIGVQAGTFAFWGMQLEVGGVATPLEKPDPQQDLDKCQRFYTTLAAQVPAAANAYTLVLPTTMRAAPATIAGSRGRFCRNEPLSGAR